MYKRVSDYNNWFDNVTTATGSILSRGAAFDDVYTFSPPSS